MFAQHASIYGLISFAVDRYEWAVPPSMEIKPQIKW